MIKIDYIPDYRLVYTKDDASARSKIKQHSHMCTWESQTTHPQVMEKHLIVYRLTLYTENSPCFICITCKIKMHY